MPRSWVGKYYKKTKDQVSLARQLFVGLSFIGMHIQQSFRIIIGFLFLLQVGYPQYGKVTITFDDRLLKGNDRQILQPLKTEIEHFFTNTVWDEDYSDLAIPLQIQIIFDGISVKGGTRTYLAQTLFSAGTDQRYFDKAVQFIYNDGTSLYYDPVIFDPLASFLAFYANLVLATEIDTYEPQGGTTLYEISRSIALRGKASDYPRGWSDRIQLVNDLSINYGLRKARYAYYYGMDLFKEGQVEEAIKQYEAYLTLNPGDYNCLLKLADCYLLLGAKEAAITGYKAALRIQPGYTQAIERLNRLTQRQVV